MAELQPCSYCGETDPFPRWLCLRKLPFGPANGTPGTGKCDYSIEAMERFNKKHAARTAEPIGRKEGGK